jgi:hypothetical protein
MCISRLLRSRTAVIERNGPAGMELGQTAAEVACLQLLPRNGRSMSNDDSFACPFSDATAWRFHEPENSLFLHSKVVGNRGSCFFAKFL